MDEFQEADILWPDTVPPSQPGEVLLVPSEILYEQAASLSSGGASLFDRSDHGFPSVGDPSAVGASSGVDEEDWQEADVLWPDTAVQAADDPRSCGGFGWIHGDRAARAGRRAKPAATARREGWSPAASSPIDIPSKVAAPWRRTVVEPLW